MRAGRGRGEVQRVGSVVVVSYADHHGVARLAAAALQLGAQRVAAGGAQVAVVVHGRHDDAGPQVRRHGLAERRAGGHTQRRERLADRHAAEPRQRRAQVGAGVVVTPFERHERVLAGLHQRRRHVQLLVQVADLRRYVTYVHLALYTTQSPRYR